MVVLHFILCENLANLSSVHHSNVDIYAPINSLVSYSEPCNSLCIPKPFGKSA